VIKLPNYELVYIVSPSITEEELPNVQDKIGDILKKSGGNITETNKWGRRKLAYPIKRFNEGTYILTKFASEAASIRNFESGLKLSDEILRYLIVKESA
jgi:small subunit ribosomal protein S6